MQIETTKSYIHKRRTWIQEGSGLLPLFTVWGTQWILNAGLDIAEEWYNMERVKLLIMLLAVLVSGWFIVRTLLQGTDSRKEERGSENTLFYLIPGILLIGTILLLEGIGAVGPLFAPIFRACVVAIVFVQFGVRLGRPLIFLGLWLFALTAVMGVWYLGYSGVVLEGMGGISLLICGYMLRSWSR
jgi:hypothetical protein